MNVGHFRLKTDAEKYPDKLKDDVPGMGEFIYFSIIILIWQVIDKHFRFILHKKMFLFIKFYRR